KSLIVDGVERNVVRCYIPDSPNGLKELTWSSDAIGLPGRDENLRVVIQSHAIEQLRNRVPFANSFWTFDSLAEPQFVEVNEDRFLVEYRFCGRRMGYFSCLRLGETVLIRTFLFLTMQGTPEARLLRKRLRLSRSDIEYNELD